MFSNNTVNIGMLNNRNKNVEIISKTKHSGGVCTGNAISALLSVRIRGTDHPYFIVIIIKK